MNPNVIKDASLWLCERFVEERYPNGTAGVSPDTFMGEYERWWNRQTEPTIRQLIDRAENETLEAMCGWPRSPEVN